MEVHIRLGIPPVKDENGNVVDEFQRAKDILIVVLPFFSASIAYFVGSAGAGAVKQEAASARAKLNAVLDAGPPGLPHQAMATHQDPFTGPN